MARRRKKDFIGGLIDDTLGGVVGAFASGFRGKKQSRKQPKSNYPGNSGSHSRESRRSSSGRNWDDGPSYRSYGYTAATGVASSPPSRGANWPLRFFVVLGIALAVFFAAKGVDVREGLSTNVNQPPQGQFSSGHAFAPSLVQSAPRIGPLAVWNAPELAWGRIQAECGPVQGSSGRVDCVTAIMQQAGASSDAVAFTRLLGGEGFMDSFRQLGDLGLVTALYPFRANDNDSVYIVNGSPPLINPDQSAAKIDIRNDPSYPSLVQRYPQLMLWSHVSFQDVRPLEGGQQFVFSMALLNGCHACEVAGAASVALEFDGTGRYVGTKLLGLTPSDQAASPR